MKCKSTISKAIKVQKPITKDNITKSNTLVLLTVLINNIISITN